MSKGEIYKHFVASFSPAREGDLKVWWIPQVPMDAFEWRVADLAQASVLLDALAAYDDFQFWKRVKGDYCNTGGLMIFRNGDWEDWETEDGDDFETWRDDQRNAA